MPLRNRKEIEKAILRELVSHGGAVRPEEIYEPLAEYFDLTPQERLGDKWANDVRWSRQDLIDLQEIDGSLRGVWKITPKGRARIQGEMSATVNSRTVDDDKNHSLDPSERRIVKIAPGEDARFWEECVEGGYICVGWDPIGDLRDFGNKEEFKAAFREMFAVEYNNWEPTISAKANELWTLRELSPGDLVVANRGRSYVLGIGTVQDPGYEWRPERTEYKHTVRVAWDTSVAKTIQDQGSWATRTVVPVPDETYQLIIGIAPIGQQVRVWWVNQGTTFEMEHAGGYLWAPQHAKNGVAFPHWTAIKELKPEDVVLNYANGALRAVSQVIDSAIEASRPAELTSDESSVEGYLARVQYTSLASLIRLETIPAEWRVAAGGPFTQQGGVKQGYLYPVPPEFAAKLKERFDDVLPAFFPSRVAEPNKVNRNTQHVWLFQANPEVWNLAEEIQKMQVGHEDEWSVGAHWAAMQPGDIVILGQTQPGAGIYGLGEITSEIFERPAFRAQGEEGAAQERAIHFRYTKILQPPIPRAVLLQDPVLSRRSIFKGVQGTNFRVTPEEWNALQQLVETAAPAESSDPVASVSFADLCAALQQERLEFTPEVVANYLLALQTKRFVILTGISGTGKTRLAMAVARAFGAQAYVATSTPTANGSGPVGVEQAGGLFDVVAVRPDWTDNRGLLGYYNPLIEKYAAPGFLKILLRAQAVAEEAAREQRVPAPFFIILDEMNLARVEQYFSDFLSGLESEEALALHDSAEVESTQRIPRQLRIPPNVFFTGTVNVDETTYMFSPKVLDRAFTIELDQVNLRTLGTQNGGPESPLALTKFAEVLRYERKPAPHDWEAFGSLLGGQLRQVVVEINDLLSEEHRHFGYRVATEIARFVNLAAQQAGTEPATLWAALDLAILEKVLPKFHGTQPELDGVLTSLFGYAVRGSGGTTAADKDLRDKVWKLRRGQLERATELSEDETDQSPRLPRTAAKLLGMWKRLRQQGFTSFIE